jgi:hypothetical protein
VADWFCPVCDERLSYGIYCKKCGVETDFNWRPATPTDRIVAELRLMPPRPYPRSVDD